MYNHNRAESRFQNAPSYSSLRQQTQHPHQHPPLPSSSLRNTTNLPHPNPRPQTQEESKQSTTASIHSARSGAVKSSRRGSLQNKQYLQEWKNYSPSHPEQQARLEKKEEGKNTYGVYMAPIRTSDGSGKENIDHSQRERTGSSSSSMQLGQRPEHSRNESSGRFSRFEDAIDTPTLENKPETKRFSYRTSRFEDALDLPAIEPKKVTRIEEGEEEEEVMSRNTRQFSKDEDSATIGRTRRRGSVQSEKTLDLKGTYKAKEGNECSDKASIRTTNTFGPSDKENVKNNPKRSSPVRTAPIRPETAGHPTGWTGPEPARYPKEAKPRKSLVGVFSKGTPSIKSVGTQKTGKSYVEKSTPSERDGGKEKETVRRAKGSWGSSHTFSGVGSRRAESPAPGKSLATPDSAQKVQIVGSIRDAFPVVRESIELDAARGLMPAFQFDAKRSQTPESLKQAWRYEPDASSSLRSEVKAHGLPPSAYRRGMTPEPFLQQRPVKGKIQASPLLTKMKSAWQLNGHQASQSADLERMQEILTDNKERSHQPMSGLAKMRSNLNLSRFKSHKASLADIQANARAQASASDKADESFTYIETGSEGDRATISDWTLASVSSVSEGLAAPWEDGGAQGGGKRVIRKKKSLAPGMLLEKMFGGKGVKDKKEKRDSRDRFSLKNAASQLTLRPRANRQQSGSDRSSIYSNGSNGPASSFANTRRMTMGQSTDPALISRTERPSSPASILSPQLPEFSFTASSHAGIAFQPNQLAETSYISRFNYGSEANDSQEVSPVGENEADPQSAAFAYSLRDHASQDDVQQARDDSRDDSLDKVEDDLDYLRARMGYLEATQGDKRDAGGPLPKRRSIKGVFEAPSETQQSDAVLPENSSRLAVPVDTTRVRHKQSLPKMQNGERENGLAKMSTVTDDLLYLVANFASSTPSSMNTVTPNKQTGMISPSESQYLDSESPTPMSRNSTALLAATKKPTGTVRQKSSPLRVSPLRLALHNNLNKRTGIYGGTLGSSDVEETVGMPVRSDHDEELLSDEDSDVGGDVNLPQTIVTEPTPRAMANGSAFACNKYAGLPRLDTELERAPVKGSSASFASTLSPADDADAPRGSFDFTGEYAQLNENGCRMSFLEELDRVGLVTEIEPSGSTEGLPALDRKASQVTLKKRSSLNREFKFGRPLPSHESAQKPEYDSQDGILFKARNSTHLPDQSVFSIASMSSLGKVVDTGIAGNFTNVFEREFAANLVDRTQPYKLHSAHQSWTDSLRSSVDKTRDSMQSVDSGLSVPTSHRRKNSSIDSAHSMMRRIGRPGVDSDRMFQTNYLYSIQGSPTTSPESKRNGTEARRSYQEEPTRDGCRNVPSYDTIIDYRNSAASNDSLLDRSRESNREDSVFSSGNQSTTFALFRPRPISSVSSCYESENNFEAPSPLARKSEEKLRKSLDIERRQREDHVREVDGPLEAVGESSFSSSGSITRPLAKSQIRPLPLVLRGSLSPSGIDQTASSSVGSPSMISMMLDPKASARQASASSTKEIRDVKRGTMDSLVSKYASGDSNTSQRWAQWQREAELEVEKSKAAWADSNTSKEVAQNCKPPKNLQEVARLIQVSRYVNTTLAEASPGQQIARRAQVSLDDQDAAASKMSKPNPLPTKFQRTDTAGSSSGTVTPATPSGLFSFAMAPPSKPSPLRVPFGEVRRPNESTGPGMDRTVKKSLTKRNSKSPGRSRVLSSASARRARLGWQRKKDVGFDGVAPKVLYPRSPSKRSHEVDNEENTLVPLSEKRKSLHKARNTVNRRSVRMV